MIKMKEEDQVETVTPNYQQILFVCDAGMGSSAMGLVAKPTIKSCELGDACDLPVRSSDEVAA